jgi:broad specificity phosphatase PhoE
MNTKAYFIRHGQTQDNIDRRIAGRTDVPLTEEGVEQAKAAASDLPLDIAVIYSSDLLRCKQTTDILNEDRNIPVIYDARLRERNFGTLEGRLWEDVDAGTGLWKIDVAQQYDYRPYGGESVEEVERRVMACMNDVQLATGMPLVVTSAGVIRILKKKLTGETGWDIPNSSIFELSLGDLTGTHI